MKGRLTKISNGYNYIKELLGFELYYGINTLYDTRVLIVSYKKTRCLFYQRVSNLRTLKLFGRKVIGY